MTENKLRYIAIRIFLINLVGFAADIIKWEYGYSLHLVLAVWLIWLFVEIKRT